MHSRASPHEECTLSQSAFSCIYNHHLIIRKAFIMANLHNDIIDSELIETAADEDRPLSHTEIEIYDRAEVRRRLNADNDGTYDFETSLSHEEEGWRRRLKALVHDPRSARRRLLMGSSAMLERLERLKQTAPHFGEMIELIVRSVRLSMMTDTALRIPPLLLLGDPGIGKSFIARQIAKAFETYYDHVSADVMSERGTLTGLSLSWKGARPGRIANALLHSTTASPIIVIDEVDKASALFPGEQPLNFLHSLLEPENASHYSDEYLTIPMRADFIIWMLTANSINNLLPSILDRLMVFDVKSPSQDQIDIIVEAIYSEENLKHHGYFDPTLDRNVVEKLKESTPRTVSKIIKIAFGFATVAGRKHLLSVDIDQARALNNNGSEKLKLGFL